MGCSPLPPSLSPLRSPIFGRDKPTGPTPPRIEVATRNEALIVFIVLHHRISIPPRLDPTKGGGLGVELLQSRPREKLSPNAFALAFAAVPAATPSPLAGGCRGRSRGRKARRQRSKGHGGGQGLPLAVVLAGDDDARKSTQSACAASPVAFSASRSSMRTRREAWLSTKKFQKDDVARGGGDRVVPVVESVGPTAAAVAAAVAATGVICHVREARRGG